jgi:hypothetical protein
LLLCVLVVVTLATGLGAIPAAGADTVQQTYAISGTIFIKSPPTLVLPTASTFTATVDTETGALTNGMVSIPTFPRGAVPEAYLTITDASPATGTLDPDTGVATVNSSYNISLSIPLLSAVCNLGPVNVTLSTSNPGGSPITGNPPSGTLTAASFAVPGVTVQSPDCDAATAVAVNAAVGIPTSNTTMTLTVSLRSSKGHEDEREHDRHQEPAPVAEPVMSAPTFTG